MRPLLTMPLFFLICTAVISQQPYIPSYEQLQEYEGLYHYTNKSTLEIAASPVDLHLYAIIYDTKYPLKPVARDVFTNSTGEQVIFNRNGSGKIRGYSVAGTSYSFIRKTAIDQRMWYPRDPPDKKKITYKRALKPKLNDGISIGSAQGAGIDKRQIQDMVAKVVDGAYKDVHSVLIFRNNKLVVEEYFYEYDRNSLHQLRSATKSFVSALIGIALGKGLIKSIDEPVISFFPEYQIITDKDLKEKVTIRHLLTNRSGFDCDISDDSSAGSEQRMGMSDDWVRFTLELPMIDTPGTKGRYCSGNVIILGRILEKVSNKKLDEFARENLFEPLGIKQFKWNFKPDRSSSDTFCQLYLRPRDMGKFGLLYLNNGQWNNKQIIPPGWVRESTTEQSMINATSYGYLWWLQWLNSGGQRYDGVAAKGNGGQRIYLFPAYQLLAVITGGNFNQSSSADAILINHILPGLK